MKRSGVARSGVTSCVLAALLFGASTPAASYIARDMEPLVLAGLLYVGAALAVTPWWVRSRPSREALRRDRGLLATAIIAGGAVGPALLTAGLVGTSAASASLLLNMELVFTVVLAATVFREYLGRNMIVAAALVTIAATLLVWEPGATAGWRSLLIVGACACWGLDNSVTSRIDQILPHHLTFMKGTVAGTMNLLLGLAITGAGRVGATAVLGALVVGALGYGASITLWVQGAQQLGAARGQVVFASAPFVGAALSWVTLGERVQLVQIGAMALAAIGVALSLRSSHEHAHRHDPISHTHEHDHTDAHHDHAHPDHAHPDAHPDGPRGRHAHPHEHRRLGHPHAHVPDLHHRHDH